jgi:hypothetical protein
LTEATGSSIIFFNQNKTYLVINPGTQPIKLIVYLVGISSGDVRNYARYTIMIELDSLALYGNRIPTFL